MTLSKEIERTTLEEHKKANAGNSGNHYYYKQLSYKALRTVDQLEAKIIELSKELDRIRGHVDEIDYAYNHWHESVRDEIGSALFQIRVGPEPIRLDPDPEEP